MRLQVRIQKLENQIIFKKPFCDCWMTYYKKMIALVYDDVLYDERNVFLPEGDFCEKCKKRVSENDLKIQKDLLAIYGKD